ncbi:MAG: universal stress protein [Bacteroidota bacterium]
MKKILVPTDFSSCATDALAVAVQIALKTRAELFILHMETVPDLTVHAGAMVTAIGEQAPVRKSRSELFRIADEVEHQGLRVHTIFVEDVSGERITDYLLPYGIDLVVMGSHGHKPFTSRILGSMARRVVRSSKVPVLIIHELPPHGIMFHDLLFASTFRRDQSDAVRYMVDLSILFGATLHVLYLNLYFHLIREDAAKETMERLLSPWPELAHTISVTDTNDESWGIRKFANMIHADLIAVSLDHQTLAGRLFNPAAAERLIISETRPLLVIPNH